MNKNLLLKNRIALIKLVIWYVDLALSYRFLGFKWFHSQLYIHKYIEGDVSYTLATRSPSMFLATNPNFKLGQLSKEELDKIISIFKIDALIKCSVDWVDSELGKIIRLLLLEYLMNSLYKNEIINSNLHININDCSVIFSKTKSLDLKLFTYDENFRKEYPTNFSTQFLNILNTLCYGEIETTDGFVDVYATRWNSDGGLEMFSIFEDKETYKYITLCKLFIEFLIKNIDLKVLHYDNFDKIEALHSYILILKLIDEKIKNLKKINN